MVNGETIGPYTIIGKLGEGGMGQVWRATDTTLGRQVAIKILPDAFAADPERLARFEREAKTLASLNHPHIAAIYGFEKSSGMHALVIELVEGEDLSQRIARGAIPLDEALPIAKQIAEALEAAHEQGIIHRDLKPANIKVRTDGTVKVLDFGLAKAIGTTEAVPYDGAEVGHPFRGAANSPTITTPAMTQAGMILGTAAYMSPEQARGKVVDKRADVWAFGCVVFEMITGHRLFKGEETSDVLAAVLRQDVDWAMLPAATPAGLRRLLSRCLKRDAKSRLRDIGEARAQLEELLTGAPDDGADIARPEARSRKPVVGWRQTLLPPVIAAAFAAAAVLALWAPWRVETPADRPLVRLDVDLGADVSLPPAATGGGSNIAISPDGGRLVYASGTPTKLFIRRLDQSKAAELPGTQGATMPVFSPDGQWVGFLSGGKAHKISVDGGAVVLIGGEANVTYRARWGDDGSVLIGGPRILRFPTDGGPPETVVEQRIGELSLLDAQTLPGGKAILFAADNPGPVDKTTIEVVTLADRQRKILVHGGASPRYLATSNGAGHLVYVSGATLFAIPFDLQTLSTRGTAVPVVDDVAHEDIIGIAQFDVSRTGTLVYLRALGGASAQRTLQWMDAAGKRVPLLAKPGVYQEVRLSPDGARIAVSVADGRSQDVSVYDTQRDATTRLTFGEGTYRYPTWSPDGHAIAVSSLGAGMLLIRADGSSQPQALTQSKAVQYPYSFTPDGKRLAFHELTPQGNRQIWTMPLEDQGGQLKAGTPEPFLKSRSNDQAPSFSPDGRWLAYQSNESSTNEVYVRSFPPPASGQGGRWLISNNGGTTPRWSRNGHNLLYQSGDQILTVAYAVKGDTFVAEKPTVWIPKLGAPATGTLGLWDVAPDGKRVVVVTPAGSAEALTQEHQVVFLQNFFDELRRKVPHP